MKQSKRLSSYLKENVIGEQATVVLKSDDGKTLTDFMMSGVESVASLGIGEPAPGKPIESITPFLDHHYLKTSQNIALPKIMTVPGVYLDVHLIPDKHHSLWIVLVDKGEEGKELQRMIQKTNEMAFTKQQLSSRKKGAGLQILSSLEFAVFKYIDTDRFDLLNSPPKWLTNFLAIQGFKKDAIDLAAHFAYLESFLVEAMAFWQSDEKEMIKSSLWTEVDAWGKEFYLEAYALKQENSQLIVIEPRDVHVSEKQALIQKAREKSLDYERVVKEEEALQKLVNLKDQFVMVVSHDLRSPVTTALGYFNLLLENEDFMSSNSEKHNKYLRVIYAQMENLLSYNEKVYHWINLELGNIKLDLVEVDFSTLVRDTVETFVPKAKDKKITMESMIDDAIVVDLDETLFRSVLNNLLGNAIKFTHPEGTITTRVYKEDQRVMVKIKDSGTGMKEEVKKELFGDYNTKHSKGTGGEAGTGLGLGICKKIVDAHGFNISVESELGKGSEFTIEI